MNISPLASARNLLALGVESFRRLAGVVRSDRRLLSIVLAMLAADLFFTLYYGAARSMLNLDLDPWLYFHKELLITTDGGVPEWINYFKTIAIIILLLRVARLTRQPIYSALLVLFFVVLLDDALEIHESMGKQIARWLDLPSMWGLRARDFGELITWAGLGLLVGPLTIFGLARSETKYRGNGIALLLPFGALLVAAILVDQLDHVLGELFLNADVLLTLAEDGGEMIAITAAAAMAFGVEKELSG